MRILKKKPITLLLRYFTVGGLERVVSSLANSYVKEGIETQVVVMSTGKRNSLITEIDSRVKVVLLSGSIRQKLTQLRNLTKGHLVHIHFGDGRIHPLIRFALTGRDVVITYHSVYRHKRTWILNRIDQFWASRASAIVAVSNAVKDFCVQDVKIPSHRVTVIQNGVDIQPVTKNVIKSKDSFDLISLASLYPHKNHLQLLNCIAGAKRMGINVTLRIIGDGPVMADLYRNCIELGIKENVEWYGAIWRKDIVQEIISSSDAFVSASNFEGLPISILEGMAYGLPMLLSDIPPHIEVAGEAALYFNPKDDNTFIQQLKLLVNNKEIYLGLKRASSNKIKDYALTDCVRGYISIYDSVS